MMEQKAKTMTWKDLPGSEEVLQRILVYGGLRQVPETLIIYGRRDLGKNLYAKALAAKNLCRHQAACGICEDCQRVLLQSHSEIFTLAGRGKIIKKEEIEDIFSFLSLAAGGFGAMRTVIIEDAHLLSVAAANSLLKVLEEPPEGSRFILTTDKLDNLMATILSRSHKFFVGPPPVSMSLAWLEKHLDLAGETNNESNLGFDREKALQALRLSGFVPKAALALLQGEERELGGEDIRQNDLLLRHVLKKKRIHEQEFVETLKKSGEGLESVLNSLEVFLRSSYLQIFDTNMPLQAEGPNIAEIKLRRQRLSRVRRKCIKSMVSLNVENMIEYILGTSSNGELFMESFF